MAVGLLVPAAMAQKPPAPPPQPAPPTGSPSSPPGSALGRIPTPSSVSAQPGDFSGDVVMYLAGSVVTDDGTVLPDNVIVERLCDSTVRQQVYASAHGDFSMALGTMADSVLDASGDNDPKDRTHNTATGFGIPRRALANCEMRASATGFRSKTVSLVQLTPSESRIDIGAIVVHRTTKIKGMTLNAAAYKAPSAARRDYEKGLEAVEKGKLADARRNFEEAVKIYPRYAHAWFELGGVLQKQTDKEAARTAYLQATAIDSKFLPPYLSLASMAFDAADWKEVLGLTRHILDLDSLDYDKVAGYVLDLDSQDYSQAYFYNAAANYKLNRIDEAEKSGLRAERLDLRPRYPQLRLLLAEIFIKKSNYAGAIDQLQTYLTIVPQGRNADLAREQLAKLEKLNSAGPASEKMDQK
jgi:tetratricopeptide (TPR) repeat protein